jgi:hypothetical protein
MNRLAYRLDLTAQSPVSDLYGNIRTEQVIVSPYPAQLRAARWESINELLLA